jgi:hypothetical protein
MGTKDAAAQRTFRLSGLAGDDGRAVLRVGGNVACAVDIKGGTGTVTTAAEGPARVVAVFDRQDTFDRIIEGRLHPIVAALQGRGVMIEGDRRFGLRVLLALRGAAPAFDEGRV